MCSGRAYVPAAAVSFSVSAQAHIYAHTHAHMCTRTNTHTASNRPVSTVNIAGGRHCFKPDVQTAGAVWASRCCCGNTKGTLILPEQSNWLAPTRAKLPRVTSMLVRYADLQDAGTEEGKLFEMYFVFLFNFNARWYLGIKVSVERTLTAQRSILSKNFKSVLYKFSN